MKLYSLSDAIVAVLSLTMLTSSAWAAAPDKKPEDWGRAQGDDIPVLAAQTEQALDDAQVKAGNVLLSAADWIDSFFDDERSFAEVNTTRAVVKLLLGYSKNDDFEFKPRFDLRLRLPKLSSRAQLIIQGSDDSDFDVEDNPLSDRPSGNDDDREEFNAAFRFFLRESEKYNISYDLGVSWDYVYTGLRYRWLHDFGSWQGRLTDRLRYYSDDGWENRAAFDLEKKFHPRWLFRSTTAADIYESEDGIPHSQKFRLYQVISEYQAMSYETGLYFDTDPSYKMTDTNFILSYRQRFYRDWLVLEVSPRISFPEDHDRDPNPGIIFKFEAAIGYKADEHGFKKIFD